MTSYGNVIRAQIFKMPENVELSQVTTAGHYILSSHLVRSLTKLDKFGKIQSDIARKWEHSSDHRTWTIWIGKEKFSNGEEITVQDVVESIKRQIRFKSGVHFSFSEIVSVETLGKDYFSVELKSPRSDFIYDLSKPEFGILYKTDYISGRGQSKFSVTSGPYFLAQHSGQGFQLKKNPHFYSDVQNKFDLTIENSDGQTSATALENGTIDFFTTQQNLSLDSHKKILSNSKLKAVKPHVAFSYWLSINTESPLFIKADNRARLQAEVKNFLSKEMDGHSWEKADQLYLPDGDGRPSKESLSKVWKEIESKAELKVSAVGKTKQKLRVIPLKMTNILIQELLDYLGQKYEVELLSYTKEEELLALIQSGDFDVKISSNDFSSIDLIENIKTTFNSSRPYIFLGKTTAVKKQLKKLFETEDKSKRSDVFKAIAIDLLSEGLIAPLAYQRVWFYQTQKFDISAWSTISPEISFWKVKMND